MKKRKYIGEYGIHGAWFVAMLILRPVSSPPPLWSITAKNRDVSTGPLARPFARSLAPLTHSLASDCSLRSRPPLRSLVRSLRSLPRSWESEFLMSQNDLVLSHSGPAPPRFPLMCRRFLPTKGFRRALEWRDRMPDDGIDSSHQQFPSASFSLLFPGYY